MSRSADEADGPANLLGNAAATWSASNWVRVAGKSIRYREAGSGPPIVLVHGLGVSADYWVRNGPPLAAAGFRVLAPDLPGFGRSPSSDPAIEISEQAGAVRAWASAIGLPPAVFVGHSLSCQTLMELAASTPGIVRGLVLAAPTGEGDTIERLFKQAVGLARDIRRESWLLAMLVLHAYLRAGPIRVLRTWVRGARHDPLALLDRVAAPAILVLGEHDPVVDRDFADQLAACLPQGRVFVVPDAAHAVIFDATGRFNAIVIEFVQSLLLPTERRPSQPGATHP